MNGQAQPKTPLRESGKPTLLTRRQFLAYGVAMAVTIPFLPITRAATPEPRTAKLRLTAGIRTLAVNGKPAQARPASAFTSIS